MRAPLAIPVAILLLSLGACGGSSTGSDKPAPTLPTKSTLVGTPAGAEVKGRLVRVGGPAPGTAVSLQGTVRIAGNDGSVTTTNVDSGGEFDIKLLPGTYTLTGTSPSINDGKQTCVTDPPATVLVKGKTITTDIVCSIR